MTINSSPARCVRPATILAIPFSKKATSMKLLAIAALFALALTAVLFAQDRSTSGDEIQVKQLERSWDEAEAKQDVNAVSALLADSLTYTDYDGSFMNKS